MQLQTHRSMLSLLCLTSVFMIASCREPELIAVNFLLLRRWLANVAQQHPPVMSHLESIHTERKGGRDSFDANGCCIIGALKPANEEQARHHSVQPMVQLVGCGPLKALR